MLDYKVLIIHLEYWVYHYILCCKAKICWIVDLEEDKRWGKPIFQRYYVNYTGLGVHSTSSILVIVQIFSGTYEPEYSTPTSKLPGVPKSPVYIQV